MAQLSMSFEVNTVYNLGRLIKEGEDVHAFGRRLLTIEGNYIRSRWIILDGKEYCNIDSDDTLNNSYIECNKDNFIASGGAGVNDGDKLINSIWVTFVIPNVDKLGNPFDARRFASNTEEAKKILLGFLNDVVNERSNDSGFTISTDDGVELTFNTSNYFIKLTAFGTRKLNSIPKEVERSNKFYPDNKFDTSVFNSMIGKCECCDDSHTHN
ncbi:MAG: hypothetical protein ACRC92_27290 [Peptostreptococcaceae bacterium]